MLRVINNLSRSLVAYICHQNF